ERGDQRVGLSGGRCELGVGRQEHLVGGVERRFQHGQSQRWVRVGRHAWERGCVVQLGRQGDRRELGGIRWQRRQRRRQQRVALTALVTFDWSRDGSWRELLTRTAPGCYCAGANTSLLFARISSQWCWTGCCAWRAWQV